MIRPRRFIPAGAGNSRRRDPQSRRHAVYPRWRGELCFSAGLTRCDNGLSPLARGTRQSVGFIVLLLRFIPAGAGNSITRVNALRRYAVYPRWRGELPPVPRSRPHTPGLSPLARGTRPRSEWRHAMPRFIPAGAGNSKKRRVFCILSAVYPRWRGELCKHNLLLINDFLSQSQSTNFIVSHKQHIHYVKEHLIH